MAQSFVFRGTARTITYGPNETSFNYHHTAVVVLTNDSITLNSGGFRTNTTKLAMNQVANEYHLGYTVYQERGQWYVSTSTDGEDIPFEDGMVLERKWGM